MIWQLTVTGLSDFRHLAYMDRRIGRVLAAATMGVAAAAVPATPALAATPELDIANAILVNQHQPEPDLLVLGTVTLASSSRSQLPAGAIRRTESGLH